MQNIDCHTLKAFFEENSQPEEVAEQPAMFKITRSAAPVAAQVLAIFPVFCGISGSCKIMFILVISKSLRVYIYII